MALAFMAVTPQASAINIIMNEGTSTSYPSGDPDGSKLNNMMVYVMGYYGDVIEASGTLTVTYSYANLGLLASTSITGTSGGKVTSCNIVVDSNLGAYDWFFDATPSGNSEFDMLQTLAGQLSSSTKAAYYNGTPNNFLEVSYTGLAKSNGAAYGKMDLWSTLLHEMGHALGMTASVASGEISDYDYDFDPDLMWGGTAAARCYSISNPYHLANVEASMYPYGSVSKRTLPSATDILAIETACGWGDTKIDLPRKDFYPAVSSDLNNRDNWEGHRMPDASDDVWVRTNDSGRLRYLTAELDVGNIVIEKSTIDTNACKLHVHDNATVGHSAAIQVRNGGEVQVNNTLTITNNSTVWMDSGSLLDLDSLVIDVGGEIYGAGTIDIEDGLNNGGKITVFGGDLIINSDVAVNLDGASPNDGQGTISVIDGNFSCNKALTDNFTGLIHVDSGCTATFSEGWRILTGGCLEMYGGFSSTRSKIAGGLFKVAGQVNLYGHCQFSCNSELESSAYVLLINSDTNLYVPSGAKMTIFEGARLTDKGRLYGLVGSNIVLDDDAVVDVRFRDHGGFTIEEGGIGNATVNAAVAFDTTSTLTFDASANGVCDKLDCNVGTTYLYGVLTLNLINGYTPAVGHSFTIITYDVRSGTFGSVVCSNPNVTLSASYSSTALTLLVTAVNNLQAVPEPSTLVLLLGSVLFLGFFRRKFR